MITERPGFVRTTAAADFAASVAPATAIPQSAFFSAGASLTPSPVMQTMWPFFCRSSTILYLCSGKTSAKPSTLSIADSASLSDLPRMDDDVTMLVPSPTSRATSFAMATWSPVTIFTVIPKDCAVLIVAAESSRGGSESAMSPTNCQSLPAAVGPGHSQGTVTLHGEAVDVPVHRSFDALVVDERQDDLRRPLCHLEAVAVSLPCTGGLGPLRDRVERLERGDLVARYRGGQPVHGPWLSP